MTPAQWEQVKEVYSGVLHLDPAARQAHLDKACGNDSVVRNEVLSLLNEGASTVSIVGLALPTVSQGIPGPVLLKDRYLKIQELSHGGFGVVWLAKDQHLHGRHVVIKVLREHVADDPWIERKFEEEIRALAQLDHPGVVGALDQGRTPEGKPFLVMQYVEGGTLRAAMKSEGLPLARVANIVRQFGDALSAAHSKGIVHRDLKPENIMLQPRTAGGDRVRLIDFGIATVREQEATPVETKVAGTLGYMAPEQLIGRPEARSDIYAFGVICYEMIGGRKPFITQNAIELMAHQQKGPPLKLKDLRPDLPPAAERIIMQALSASPAERPPDARVFGEQLAAVLDVFPDTVKEEPVLRSRPKRLVIMMVAALIGLIVATVLWIRSRTPPAVIQVAAPAKALQLTIEKPSGSGALRVSSDTVFHSDDKVRLDVISPDRGFIYVVNQSENPPSINAFFPNPSDGHSSATGSGEHLLIPRGGWLRFDSAPGTERLWVVWSRSAIAELESAAKWINKSDQGRIGDAAQERAILDILHESDATKSPADRIVTLVKLVHR